MLCQKGVFFSVLGKFICLHYPPFTQKKKPQNLTSAVQYILILKAAVECHNLAEENKLLHNNRLKGIVFRL